ncbi:tetratricopeptide repeat protein [bacterium]|nr:tetratricopeptide repeat protein [bacterium]
MKRIVLGFIVFSVLCVNSFTFDNYKDAFNSGTKKTEGFGDWESARKDFTEALSLTKRINEKGDATYQIGETYFWENNYQQARNEYAKIKDIEKITVAYLAMAQIRVGDTFAAEKNYSQARQEYQKVLQIEGKIPNTLIRRFTSVPKVEAQYKIGEMFRAEHNYSKAKEEFAKILNMPEATEKDKLEAKYRIKSIYR